MNKNVKWEDFEAILIYGQKGMKETSNKKEWDNHTQEYYIGMLETASALSLVVFPKQFNKWLFKSLLPLDDELKA